MPTAKELQDELRATMTMPKPTMPKPTIPTPSGLLASEAAEAAPQTEGTGLLNASANQVQRVHPIPLPQLRINWTALQEAEIGPNFDYFLVAQRLKGGDLSTLTRDELGIALQAGMIG